PGLRDDGTAASNRACPQAVIGGRSRGSTRQHSNAVRGVVVATRTAHTPSRSCRTAEAAAFDLFAGADDRFDCASPAGATVVTSSQVAMRRGRPDLISKLLLAA